MRTSVFWLSEIGCNTQVTPEPGNSTTSIDYLPCTRNSCNLESDGKAAAIMFIYTVSTLDFTRTSTQPLRQTDVKLLLIPVAALGK
jgi:hypothetical protein